MKTLGGWLFFFGIGSIILSFVGYEFKLLMWIETWGETVAWLIRAALVVAGGALWFVGNKQEQAAETSG